MYRHTQPGVLVLALMGPVILLSLALSVATGWHPIAVGAVVVLLAVLFLFHSLTVEVTSRTVTLWFGPGLIRRSFPVRDIRGARSVKNRWYYGWGIRWTPHGWLYNVSGLDAVEIELGSGKSVRIGTDRPEELTTTILQALRTS